MRKRYSPSTTHKFTMVLGFGGSSGASAPVGSSPQLEAAEAEVSVTHKTLNLPTYPLYSLKWSQILSTSLSRLVMPNVFQQDTLSLTSTKERACALIGGYLNGKQAVRSSHKSLGSCVSKFFLVNKLVGEKMQALGGAGGGGGGGSFF